MIITETTEGGFVLEIVLEIEGGGRFSLYPKTRYIPKSLSVIWSTVEVGPLDLAKGRSDMWSESTDRTRIMRRVMSLRSHGTATKPRCL